MTLRFIPKLALAFARLVAAHPLAAAAIGVGALGVAAVMQNQSGTAVIKDPEDPEKSQMDETREFGGMTGAPISADMLGFSGGGEAQGTDVIPAMLTPGEFIMSRGLLMLMDSILWKELMHLLVAQIDRKGWEALPMRQVVVL